MADSDFLLHTKVGILHDISIVNLCLHQCLIQCIAHYSVGNHTARFFVILKLHVFSLIHETFSPHLLEVWDFW